jgi:chromosome partitioning protein
VGAELELVMREKREFVMKGILDQVKNEYDYIIIDCLPSLGIITLNALVAADTVLIPVQCEYFSLEGLGKLQQTFNMVKKNFNPSLEIEGILLSMYDGRLRLANVVVNEVREFYKEKVFDTIIHRNSKISEAPNMHLPVVMYDAGSRGTTNFLNLAQEFLLRNKDNIKVEGVS